MRLIQNAFTKIKDYFTANSGRKIFFYGLVTSLFLLILYVFAKLNFLRVILIIATLVMCVGTLVDSMQTRVTFLKKIREIQYEHLKEIADKQESGEEVVVTSTFSDEEKSYLRRRKWWFIFIIVFKMFLVIALFSLLLRS